MGFFDKIKSALGGASDSAVETVKGPSTVLREAGIDPDCVDCKIGADGSLTVTGTVASAEERERIVGVLEGIPQVNRVINEINVSVPVAEPAPAAEVEVPAPASPAPAAEVEADDAPEPTGEETVRTYTVQSGDTLWKIAQEMYGDGSKYMRIFEANTDLLDDPDKIMPGQELKIPNA